MPNSRRAVAEAVMGLAAFAFIAAGPATLPADKNSVEYAVAPVNARFRVPKLWQKRDTPGGAHADALFLFDPAAKKRATSFTSQQLVEVYLDKPKDTQKTLADFVKDVKAGLTTRTPTLKFTKDAAAAFAGRPAWALYWTERITLQAQNPDGTKSSAGFANFDRVSFLFFERDTLCMIALHADTRLMPSLIQKAEPVAKSITWDQPPATGPSAK